MSKLLFRIVVFLLIPCLMASPVFASSLNDSLSAWEQAGMRVTIAPPFTQEALAPCAAPFLRGLTEHFLAKEVLIQLVLVAIGLAAAHAGHSWGYGVNILAMIPHGGKLPQKKPLTAEEALVQLQGNEEAVCEWLSKADPSELKKILKNHADLIEKVRSTSGFRTLIELSDSITKTNSRSRDNIDSRIQIPLQMIRKQFKIILPPRREERAMPELLKITRAELRVLLAMREAPTEVPGPSIKLIQDLLGWNQSVVEGIFGNLLSRQLIARVTQEGDRRVYFRVTPDGYRIINRLRAALEQRRAATAPGDQDPPKKKLLGFIFLLLSVGHWNDVLTLQIHPGASYRHPLTLSAA